MITGILQQIFEAINQFTGDYGLTIIIITLGIKMLLFPLSLKQRKSMKQQTVLNEKMNALKAKYKNNEKKLNEEMTQLMQKEGTGLAGCLLSFIQLPVIFSLNKVIRISITGAAGTLVLPWVTSLLVRDPLFLLPLVSVLFQILPQLFPYIGIFKNLDLPKSNPAMMVTSILMCVFIGVSLPSGVGLYYCISGAVYAAEQFVLNIVELLKMKKLNTQQA